MLVMLLMAVGAPWIAHYAYDESIPGARMKPPSAQFWMGTDNLSRDMWSRVVYGARVSVTVGFVTIALSTLVALAIGVSSAYIGGVYDMVVTNQHGRRVALVRGRSHSLTGRTVIPAKEST